MPFAYKLHLRAAYWAVVALLVLVSVPKVLSGQEEVVLLQPQAADDTTFVRPAPPALRVRSRVSYRLHVTIAGARSGRTFSGPGRYPLAFACRYEPDKQHSLILKIEEAELEAIIRESEKQEYVSRSAEELSESRERARQELVSSRVTFRRSLPYNPALSGVKIKDGTVIPIGAAFSTEEGFVCLIPRDETHAMAAAQASVSGQRLIVRGTELPADEEVACLLVNDVQFAPSGGDPRRDAAWKVRLTEKDGTSFVLYGPGIYEVGLPCSDGKKEILLLALREIKVADLRINGHSLEAEVADTTASRRYGLQGRSGLEPDTGMLFVFEKPFRPTFLMKTVSFPLSIAFFGSDGAIVSIHKMFPGDQRPARPPRRAKYALETSQGWFEGHGIRGGATVEFQWSIRVTACPFDVLSDPI